MPMGESGFGNPEAWSQHRWPPPGTLDDAVCEGTSVCDGSGSQSETRRRPDPEESRVRDGAREPACQSTPVGTCPPTVEIGPGPGGLGSGLGSVPSRDGWSEPNRGIRSEQFPDRPPELQGCLPPTHQPPIERGGPKKEDEKPEIGSIKTSFNLKKIIYRTGGVPYPRSRVRAVRVATCLFEAVSGSLRVPPTRGASFRTP